MPNGPEKKLNFVPKIYDTVAKAWKPFYIPPDATDKVQGDVKLSDSTDSTLNAATGMTAATPVAIKNLKEDLTDKIEEVRTSLGDNKLDKVQVEAQTVVSQVTFNDLVTGQNGFKGNLNGNSSTATKLQTQRTFSVKSGNQAAVSSSFDGSQNVSLTIGALDATTLKGLVPIASIPQGAMERVVSYTTLDAAISAYTSASTDNKPFSEGDTIRVTSTDPNMMYAVIGDPSSKANYVEYSAGSAMSANEADKLTVGTVGSTSVPVYFNNGKPSVISLIGLTNGGTGATTVPAISNNLKYSSLGERAAIQKSSDLNNYTTPGSYAAQSTEIASTVSNTPNGSSSTAFILDVISNTGSGTTYVRQRLSYYNDFDVWERVYQSSGQDSLYPSLTNKWSSWKKTGEPEGENANVGVVIDSSNLGVNSSYLTDGDSGTESEKIIQIISGSSSGTTTDINTNTSLGSFKLGAYSIILRMKSSSINSSVGGINVIIKNDSGLLLKQVEIHPDMFNSANTWECLSFGVNFSGNKNSKYSITLQNISGANCTMNIDYIRIIPSGTALGSIG